MARVPKNTAAVAAQAQHERDRKAASKQALHVDALKQLAVDRYEQDRGVMNETYDEVDYVEAIAKHGTATKAWAFHMRVVEAQRESQAAYEADEAKAHDREARAAEYAANALKSAQEDAAATGMPVEAILADMGLDATGHPLPTAKAGTERPTYTGPMLALRERAKRGAYVKGANGNPHTGDALAALCAEYPRETIVKALIAALGLGHNPYAHLNPGQQSMNLRNKARAAIKNGLIQHADVDACLKAQSAMALLAAE